MAKRNLQDSGKPDGKADHRRDVGPRGRVASGEVNGLRLADKLVADDPAILGEPALTTKTDGEAQETSSVSDKIRTVEDLLRHIGADMTRYEVERSEGTTWNVGTKHPQTGEVTVTPLYRVWVRLKPRVGAGPEEVIKAMIAGAAKAGKIVRHRAKAHKADRGMWQVLIVSDPHFAKYAWSGTTGGDDYDLDHADRLVRTAGLELLDKGDLQKPAKRSVVLLGDIYHYDTPSAKTTQGTQLERDGRMERMIETGSEAIMSLIHRSAETCQTEVVTVPGNHDETCTAWLRYLLSVTFAKDKRVNVHNVYKHRQYVEYEGNLLGFAHGDKARNKLAALMTLEASAAWARCPYREIHTGHLHKQAAKIRRIVESDGIDTVDGVVIRTAPALCPPDDWHSNEGYIGSRQAMETWFYRPGGGLAGMLVADGRKA